MGDVHIEKVLGHNKILFGEENYKYFIGYLYNDHKFKPSHIILPKTSAYVFLIEDDDLLKNIIIFRIKSVLISKRI